MFFFFFWQRALCWLLCLWFRSRIWPLSTIVRMQFQIIKLWETFGKGLFDRKMKATVHVRKKIHSDWIFFFHVNNKSQFKTFDSYSYCYSFAPRRIVRKTIINFLRLHKYNLFFIWGKLTHFKTCRTAGERARKVSKRSFNKNQTICHVAVGHLLAPPRVYFGLCMWYDWPGYMIGRARNCRKGHLLLDPVYHHTKLSHVFYFI